MKNFHPPKNDYCFKSDDVQICLDILTSHISTDKKTTNVLLQISLQWKKQSGNFTMKESQKNEEIVNENLSNQPTKKNRLSFDRL